MKQELENLPENSTVNWSEIARRYKITEKNTDRIAKHGGQIAKDWLVSQGIDVSKFENKSRRFSNVRRKKMRMSGGEVAFPCLEPIKKTREKLKQKIEEGQFKIGEIIVPRKYQKLIVKNGQLVKKEFCVEGRKIPLKEIWEQEKFMKTKDNCHINERTDNEIKGTLKQLYEYDSSMTPEEAKELLKTFQSTRHIMY